ncbi:MULTISPECIES: peptidoglycan-binding protein LysM [Tenacibaculum]|uniref:peptidoglycan-binding protein LysM n=1 Tax=Tenacibaculum TaxID=104267 RepID=UPI001F0A7CAF|nr:MULTISPECIES: peptidoglycan-binding protein LysM [Tenacibaculum]MCH3882531.1 peptidoglycan-binding protein LysM [Tenacibaculum aquimarinum]MCH3885654.1 peptidoglycan-binding protein LysM [Tenacibaculum aquimarinum]MDO6599983.1 peptidoglycan-binding protein LysM [Tenacibaculum sp. 1_MG-2023]
MILVFIGLTNFTTTNPKESKTINKATVTNTNSVVIPLLQKDFIGFKEALAFKESQGKYNAVNSLGYLGKYQFGKTTLQRFRIYNTKAFLNTPELQEKAFIALCKVNKYILRKDIKRSVGKTINGIKITESGILAAAHLSGAGNVKKYLRSKGATKFSDAYGATIESYLKKFKGYDVSVIKANKKATV